MDAFAHFAHLKTQSKQANRNNNINSDNNTVAKQFNNNDSSEPTQHRRASMPELSSQPQRQTDLTRPLSMPQQAINSTTSAPLSHESSPYQPHRSLSYAPTSSSFHQRNPSGSPSLLRLLANKIEEYADAHQRTQFSYGHPPHRLRSSTFDSTCQSEKDEDDYVNGGVKQFGAMKVSPASVNTNRRTSVSSICSTVTPSSSTPNT